MNAPSTIHIRPADKDDRDFVLDLAHRFAQTRAAWRGFDEVKDGSIRALALAFDAPSSEAAIFIASNANGERLGFAYVIIELDFFTREPHGHLSEIATVGDGSGAAHALMLAAEAWSQTRGHRYLSLNVNEVNVRAAAFYERRNYVPEYRHLIKLFPEPKPFACASRARARRPTVR